MSFTNTVDLPTFAEGCAPGCPNAVYAIHSLGYRSLILNSAFGRLETHFPWAGGAERDRHVTDIGDFKELWASLPHTLKAVMVFGAKDSMFFAGSIFAFAILGALMFAFARGDRRKLSAAKLAKYVFPPELYKSPHTRVDLAVFIFSKVFWGPLVVALVTLVAVAVAMQNALIHIFGERPALLHQSWQVFWSQFLVSYFSGELSVYLAHRLMHMNKLLWSFHRPHHSAEVLTFLTANRNHPLEMLLFSIFGALIGGASTATLLYATGASMHPALPMALLVIGAFAGIMDKLEHSHLRVSFGPFNFIFQSARMHQIHHSAEFAHRNRNFGATSSLFDWIFGTIYIPKAQENFRLGLSETEIGGDNPHKRARDIYLEPFAHAWRALTGRGP
jgi:sterol desaturase/sphingolipid hydroxylase (fatty acid hydroxylase superfamily)